MKFLFAIVAALSVACVTADLGLAICRQKQKNFCRQKFLSTKFLSTIVDKKIIFFNFLFFYFSIVLICILDNNVLPNNDFVIFISIKNMLYRKFTNKNFFSLVKFLKSFKGNVLLKDTNCPKCYL